VLLSRAGSAGAPATVLSNDSRAAARRGRAAAA
jgi:hypothetical protein